MQIWSAEIKELNQIYQSVRGSSPKLEKELAKLVTTDDENMLLVYSRRCLEVIITDLCEIELKRDRGSEPLQRIIDKFNKDKIVPHNIIVSMQNVNSMSTFGAHPKEFEMEQVKPVLNNLQVVIKWYLKNREHQLRGIDKLSVQQEDLKTTPTENKTLKRPKRVLLYSIPLLLIVAVLIIVETGIFSKEIEKSVAVLPFRNDSPEDSTQYFMDGVMEELLNKLQLIESLRVIGRTSVEQFRGQDKSIQEIAKELGVNYIVEGSGQKSGNALRMRVQLLTAKNERHLWGDSFEQENLEIKDYFKAQSGFAENIAKELNAALSVQEEKRIKKVPSVNLDAYEAYLKSNWAGDLGPDALFKAKDYLEDAIQKAPDWAPLYGAMAITWFSLATMGGESPDIAFPLVYENLSKALELEPEAGEAHYIKALMALVAEWDWDKAENEFIKAIDFNPNNAIQRIQYSLLLYMLQRPEEARRQAELFYKLDPLNPIVQTSYAMALLYDRDCKGAMSVLSPLLEKDPDNFYGNTMMSWAALFCGDLELAFKTDIAYLQKIFPLIQADVSEIQKIYDEEGYFAANMEIIRKLEILAETVNVPNSEFAYRYYHKIKNDEKALDWLEKAFEAHENIIDISTGYFGFTRLYNNPRFITILEKMNLPLPKTD